MKLEKPVAVCTVCYTHTENSLLINERCKKKFNGKRSKGVYRSALKVNDWKECPTCGATGREKADRCSQCSGFGWIFVRSR